MHSATGATSYARDSQPAQAKCNAIPCQWRISLPQLDFEGVKRGLSSTSALRHPVRFAGAAVRRLGTRNGRSRERTWGATNGPGIAALLQVEAGKTDRREVMGNPGAHRSHQIPGGRPAGWTPNALREGWPGGGQGSPRQPPARPCPSPRALGVRASRRVPCLRRARARRVRSARARRSRAGGMDWVTGGSMALPGGLPFLLAGSWGGHRTGGRGARGAGEPERVRPARSRALIATTPRAPRSRVCAGRGVRRRGPFGRRRRRPAAPPWRGSPTSRP